VYGSERREIATVKRVPPPTTGRKKSTSYRRQGRRDGNDLAFVEIDRRRQYLGPYDTPASRKRYHRLVAKELVPPGVYEGLRAMTGLKYGRCGAPDNPLVQPVPEDLIGPVKEHVSRQVAVMIDLQLLAGARPGEIVQLRPCDIDRTTPMWTYRPPGHKTEHHGHERVTFLGPRSQQVLSPFVLRPHNACCFSPAEAEEEHRQALSAQRETPLSCGNRSGSNRRAKPGRKPGDHYTVDSYRRAIDRGLENAFPSPGNLAKQEGETHKQCRARLTKRREADRKQGRRALHRHPHRLRHNYATNVRREFGQDPARQIAEFQRTIKRYS